MTSNAADETPISPNSLWTRRVLPNGDDESVGVLQVDDLANPPEETWPMSQEPYVFISQTGRGNVKELVARPVHFFLENVVQVEAFLDDRSIRAGMNTTEVLAAAAYRCTHALIVFSPFYRSRRFCVKELNTFMKRHRQGDGIRIIPTLWGVSDLNDYHSDVSDITWVACTSTYIVDFLVQTLWPELLNVFDRAALDKQVLEDHLCDYVEQMRGGRSVVPQELESFYARHRGQRHSRGGVFSIPDQSSSTLRKLLHDADNHYEATTGIVPNFQEQVQLHTRTDRPVCNSAAGTRDLQALTNHKQHELPIFGSDIHMDDLSCSSSVSAASICSIEPFGPNADSSPGRIFINHTGQDSGARILAEMIWRDLVQEGYRCFFDATSLEVGVMWKRSIEMHIQACDIFLCIVSKEWYFRHWCLRELNIACESKCKIIPLFMECGKVRYDNDFKGEFHRCHASCKKNSVNGALIDQFWSNVINLQEIQTDRSINLERKGEMFDNINIIKQWIIREMQ
jgi:hypothetical protein